MYVVLNMGLLINNIQRMAELREKKKGGIGAKRVQGIGL